MRRSNVGRLVFVTAGAVAVSAGPRKKVLLDLQVKTIYMRTCLIPGNCMFVGKTNEVEGLVNLRPAIKDLQLKQIYFS